MKGYYTRQEITEACRGLSGLVELVKRGDEWQHVYPPHDKAEIVRINPYAEHMLQLVYDDVGNIPFCDTHLEELDRTLIKEGFEYYDMIGTPRRVISVANADQFLMPIRW